MKEIPQGCCEGCDKGSQCMKLNCELYTVAQDRLATTGILRTAFRAPDYFPSHARNLGEVRFMIKNELLKKSQNSNNIPQTKE